MNDPSKTKCCQADGSRRSASGTSCRCLQAPPQPPGPRYNTFSARESKRPARISLQTHNESIKRQPDECEPLTFACCSRKERPSSQQRGEEDSEHACKRSDGGDREELGRGRCRSCDHLCRWLASRSCTRRVLGASEQEEEKSERAVYASKRSERKLYESDAQFEEMQPSS